MTDRTQPDSASTTGSTHIIRYALELGLLWIDGDGRNKVREALDALDTLEAQLEAIGAGGEYPALVCDYCGALTPDPWHSSGMLHGKMSKHIHSCDACAARGAKKYALRTYPNPIVPLIKPVSEQEKMRALYLAFSNLMAYLGRNGAIHSDGHAVDVLMNCLNDLDGGEFDETLFAASPTPPAEQQAASSAVLKAIREANMQLVRTGDDAFMLVPYKVATAEQAAPKTAPQQEAQEPALFVSAKQLADLTDPSHATGGSYLPARKTRAGLFTQPLYKTPQPTPAPLSERDALSKAKELLCMNH